MMWSLVHLLLLLWSYPKDQKRFTNLRRTEASLPLCGSVPESHFPDCIFQIHPWSLLPFTRVLPQAGRPLRCPFVTLRLARLSS